MNILIKYSVKDIFRSVVAGFLMGMLWLLPVPNHAHGQFGGSTPYGGLITVTFQCTCTENELIYVQDYASGGLKKLIYQQGISKLYDNSNVNKVGGYLLGTYSQSMGTSCEIATPDGCYEMQSDGVMDSMPGTGTS